MMHKPLHSSRLQCVCELFLRCITHRTEIDEPLLTLTSVRTYDCTMINPKKLTIKKEDRKSKSHDEFQNTLNSIRTVVLNVLIKQYIDATVGPKTFFVDLSLDATARTAAAWLA